MMTFFRFLLMLCLLFSSPLYAAYCSDIWTQAIKSNSSVPPIISLPATTNQVFPQPLQPTDYYYSGSGSYFIENNVVRTTTGATTRLFVNGNLTINNNVDLNASGLPENLIIVVTGNLVLSNNVTINGFILAGGAVQLSNNVVVNGAITAKGAVSNAATTINYLPDAIPSLVGGVVCDTAPTPTPLQAHYPLDICSTTTSTVIEDLTGRYPATAVNVPGQSAGQVLEAADFSASGGDYINVPPAALNGLANFTVSMWFYLDAGSGFRELFSASSNSSDTEIELYINSSNELRAGLKGSYYTFSGGINSPVVNNNTWYQVTLVRSGSQLCLYLDNNLLSCVSATNTSLSVARAAIGMWWRSDGTRVDDFRGDIDEVLLFNQALSTTQIQQMYINQKAGLSYDGSMRTSKCTQCLSDDFSSNALSTNWVTTNSSGSFTPQVVNGRLRMTQAVGNQSTSATYQRLYPAANNLVIVEFDYSAYGGNGADGLAVVLSDATVTPQAGSFGGPLGYGYKPGIPGFAGGWLGFGLDEFGNYSNEGGTTNVGRRQQSVVVRGSGSGNSGYNYLRGTCSNGTTNINANCLTPAVDGNQNNPHRYRFTIDSRTTGTTMVSVERNSGSGFTTLIAPFNAQTQTGQAAVPENFLLSLTGSTGGSTNIHELDNLSICALRSLPVGQQIDHFEFDYTGQALTCKPESFTVRACANSSCSQLITNNVSATLSPVNSGNVNWVGGNTLNFSGGQTSVSLRRTVAGSTTIGVSGSVPSTKPLSQTLCRAGSGALSAAACSISFADSGLVFDVPDGIANQNQQNILLSAVRKDNSTQRCVPEFANVTRNVAFWSDYITPGSLNRPASLAINVNNVDVGLTEATKRDVSLSFNAQGQAAVSVNYSDAGLVQLNARYTGSAASSDSGLVMNGADQFIRRPLGLCIKTGGECSAADASCGLFRRAGEPFSLKITAHSFVSASTDLCLNPVTPNFSMNNIALTHSLKAPSGGQAGSILLSQYNHTAAVTSENTLQQSVSEVGVFTFNVPALTYLTMADPIPAASSIATGRFIPDRFSVTSGAVLPACGTFSYFGQQNISTAFELQALNLSGQRTQNYTGAFAKLNVGQWTNTSATNGMRYSAPQLSDGATLLAGSAATTGNWDLGRANMLVTHYASRPASPAAPLALNLYATPRDSDNVTVAAAALLNTNPTELRYGRLVLQNAAGPEEEPLPLAFNTQYWQGTQFVTNSADSCSAISASNALLSTTQGSPALSLGGSGGTVQQGQFPARSLWLNAPGSTGNWLIEYQAEPWLQYHWRGATPNYQQNPSAEVIFGRFRGNPRQISWRERFQ